MGLDVEYQYIKLGRPHEPKIRFFLSLPYRENEKKLYHEEGETC